MICLKNTHTVGKIKLDSCEYRNTEDYKLIIEKYKQSHQVEMITKLLRTINFKKEGV